VKIIIPEVLKFLIPRDLSLEAFGYGRPFYAVTVIAAVLAGERVEINASSLLFVC
jgi:hypothetical protein